MAEERSPVELVSGAGRSRPRYSALGLEARAGGVGRPRPGTAKAARAVRHLLGRLEAKIMESMWRRREATVREVLAELSGHRQLAYTTVMTVMVRLAERGLLRRRRRGKAHLYEVALGHKELLQHASRRLVRALIDDFGEVAVTAMVEEIRLIDPARLDRLQTRLKGAESTARVRRGSARGRRRRRRLDRARGTRARWLWPFGGAPR
jgi:predicted transcriptional regulator